MQWLSLRRILFLMVFVMVFIFSPQVCYTGNLSEITDLNLALEMAKRENKMLFIQYGRPQCGNCQHLKGLIRANKVKLSDKEFIYVDLNCDIQKSNTAFKIRYTVDGTTLPFVVIADSEGEQLVERSGYGSVADYNNLIKRAKVKNEKRLENSQSVDSPVSNSEKSEEGSKVKTLEDIRKAVGLESPSHKK